MGIVYKNVSIFRDNVLKYEIENCTVSVITIDEKREGDLSSRAYKLAYIDGHINGNEKKVTVADFEVRSMTSQLLEFRGVMHDDIDVVIDVSVICVIPMVKSLHFKTCENCSSSFRSSRSDARFCSEKCRNTAAKRRARGKKKKQK